MLITDIVLLVKLLKLDSDETILLLFALASQSKNQFKVIYSFLEEDCQTINKQVVMRYMRTTVLTTNFQLNLGAIPFAFPKTKHSYTYTAYFYSFARCHVSKGRQSKTI